MLSYVKPRRILEDSFPLYVTDVYFFHRCMLADEELIMFFMFDSSAILLGRQKKPQIHESSECVVDT